MTLAITDANFEEEVLQSDTPVLVDFWAEWCGPCRQLAPVLDDLSTEMDGSLKIVKVNIDESPEAPSKYGVRGIPTMILFKDGKPAATKVGAAPKSALLEWVQEEIA